MKITNMKSSASLLILLTLFLCGNLAIAQQSRMSYRLTQLMNTESNPLKPISVLVKGNVNHIREEVRKMGGHFKFAAGDISSVILPVQALYTLSHDPQVIRMEEGRKNLQPMNDQMLINNKIDLVHQGVSPLTQGYDGKDVIVGIIDTGIDFTHPDFIDSLGNSRVLWIWDHLLPNGPNTPSTYGYGQEFSNADILAGNATAHVDGGSHGTHVSGIATSNGRSHSEYTGVAPKADIIAVSIDLTVPDDNQLSSIADAVDYIYAKADAAGKPCVINISLGSYFGSHDGKDLDAQLMDYLVTATPSKSLVAAAGNAGNLQIHLQHNLANDTLFTWFVQTSSNGIYIELWADTADLNNVQFTIGADQVNPVFADRGQLPYTSIQPNLNLLTQDTLFSIDGNRLGIIQKFGQLINDSYSMIYYITPDSSNYYWRLMSNGTGKFDLWSFEMIETGLPTPIDYPEITKYVLPDVDQTICSSFQCSDKVISVGQYVNRNNYIDVLGNLQTFPITVGALSASSSRGPTRDGRIKPDITSTGELTMSAFPLFRVPSAIQFIPNKLAADSIHIRDGGTSSAAPVVSGLGALYFQKNPTANWNDFKTSVKLCSVQDVFTNVTPNTIFGYGKLDGLAVMTGCNALSVRENVTNKIQVYPNPVNNNFTVTFPRNENNKVLELTNILGKKLRSIIINANQENITLEKGNLPAGIYLVSIHSQGKIATQRIIFE